MFLSLKNIEEEREKYILPYSAVYFLNTLNKRCLQREYYIRYILPC